MTNSVKILMNQKTFFHGIVCFTTNSDMDTKNYESANEIL